MEELVKDICALDGGGFIVIGRDLFDGGNVHQHEVTDVAENIGDTHRKEHVVCAEPLEVCHGFPAKSREEGMEQTELCVVDVQQPHVTDSDRRDDVGHIDDGAEELLTAQAARQDDRKNDRKAEAGDAAEQPDLTNVLDRGDEQRCVEQFNVVVQSGPRPSRDSTCNALHAEKAHDGGSGDRINEDQAEQQHGWAHEV